MLLPGDETENNLNSKDDAGLSRDDGGNPLPSLDLASVLPSPVSWGGLEYRAQAVILKVLTRFYANELFPFFTSCDALHLERYEVDAFLSRHMLEWRKQLTGRPVDTLFVDKGLVHVACKYLKGQLIQQEAIDAAMKWSLQTVRWPLGITTDGFSMPVDQFMSATFPSLTPFQAQSSFPDQGQIPQSLIVTGPKLCGIYHFALIPGEEGTPDGVRFTDIMVPPMTIVVGPHGQYTLHHGGRYLIEYLDWCQDSTKLRRLSHFSIVEGRWKAVASALQSPENTHGGNAPSCDSSVQKHYVSPAPFDGQTDIPREGSDCTSNNNGINTKIEYPAQSAGLLCSTTETFRPQNNMSLAVHKSDTNAMLIEAISQAMPETGHEKSEQEFWDAEEMANIELCNVQRSRERRWNAEQGPVAPKDLIKMSMPKLPAQSSLRKTPGITSEELAKMPMGPAAPTNTSIIWKPADYEPFLTIRLPHQYYVIGPRSQVITFDGDFGVDSAPTACSWDPPGQSCQHGKLPYSVGGVYSFHLPSSMDKRYKPAELMVPQLPASVFARFLLPNRFALYRDHCLMPRAIAPGYHELRMMRMVQRLDDNISDMRITADLANQDGYYMVLNDMAPYRPRIMGSSAGGSDDTSPKAGTPTSGEEEKSEVEDIPGTAIDALESMPIRLQSTMLEAHRILAPYRAQFEEEGAEEQREEILAEKREIAREKARAVKERQDEKKRQSLQRRVGASEGVTLGAPDAPAGSNAGSNAGHHTGPSGSGTGVGLGMGLVSFSDELLQRQIESSSSNSSDSERTVKKKRKLAEQLERIPDDDDDDATFSFDTKRFGIEDKTFSLRKSTRKRTQSTKAQQQEGRGEQKREEQEKQGTLPKKTRAPTPVTVKHQSSVPPTPASQAGTINSSVKRGRGRPRKHPLPDAVQPQGQSTPATADNAQPRTEGSSTHAVNAPRVSHWAPNTSLISGAQQQLAMPRMPQHSMMPGVVQPSAMESNEQASADPSKGTRASNTSP